MTDENWGKLVDLESYGRAGDTKDDFVVLTYNDAKTKYQSHRHASHGLLFARSDEILWELYSVKAVLLMQMRFDGLIGFPGGLVEIDEDPLVGLNRELQEEIGLDLEQYRFADDSHIISFLHECKNLVLHFYVKEVTLCDMKKIEGDSLKAYEYGIENMGNIRPPLFTMGDHFRGFPAFLTNNFAGNAREELLFALVHLNLFTKQEIERALESCEHFKAS